MQNHMVSSLDRQQKILGKKRKIHNDFQYQSGEINDNQKKVCNNFKLK